ncbi:MAG TPA: hypothetical protein ENK72_01285 [Epsilonproteobacteria bacterium]|nr:hypothetical protein [Campylobacterota bacterium]
MAQLAVRFYGRLTLEKIIFARYDYPQLHKTYDDFKLDTDYSHKHLYGLSKESGAIRGVIVDIVESLPHPVSHVLLPGEYNTDRHHYAKLFNLDVNAIVTAGLGGDMDHEWNYENNPPQMGKFDLIISQAMLEHLLNPYKHVSDLSLMLEEGGTLILHTHTPGFQYHKYPIDCLRFYPDWFEEVAKRLGLVVYDRYIGDLRICYTLHKPAAENS